MKKQVLSAFACIAFTAAFAQQNTTDSLRQIAIARGIAEVDIPGFIRLHTEEKHNHSSSFQREPDNFAPVNIANPGFETGDFTGWTGFIGNNDVSSDSNLTNIQTGFFSTTVDAQLTDMNARHTIMTLTTNDPNSGIMIVPPGYGTYVARLNNSSGGYQGTALEQTWAVTAAETYIKINYSVVLNDGGHFEMESPYFYYIITDSSGADTIAYRRDNMFNSPPGYLLSSTLAGTYYLPWQNDSVDLSNYIGQSVKIRFLTAGCIFGGHFAYCYVDISNPTSLTTIDESQPTYVFVSPNPSNGKFTIAAPDMIRSVSLYDMSGRLVNQTQYQPSYYLNLDLSENNAGFYILKIETGRETIIRKIMIR
jgi:hypothetical protein